MADEQKPKKKEEKGPSKEGPPKKEVNGLDSLLQETEFVKKTNERLNAIDNDIGKLGGSFGASIEKLGDAIKGLIKANVETIAGISERISRLEARINEISTAVTPVPGGGAASGGEPPISQAPPVGGLGPEGMPVGPQGPLPGAEVTPQTPGVGVPVGGTAGPRGDILARLADIFVDKLLSSGKGEAGGARPAIDEVLGYIAKVDEIKASGRKDLMDSAKYFAELMKAMKGLPAEVVKEVPGKITPPPGVSPEEKETGGGSSGGHLGTILE